MQILQRASLLSITIVLGLALAPLGRTQDRYVELRQKFEAAMAINAKGDMEKLLREYEDEMVGWIMDTAESIANAPNKAVFDRMNAMKTTWEAVHRTDFCKNMEKYFSYLSSTMKREREKLKGEYLKNRTLFVDAIAEKGNKDSLGLVGQNLTGIAKAFEEMGDKYFASQSWVLVGLCMDEDYRGAKNADLPRAVEAYGKGVKLREEIGLQDRTYKQTKPRYEQLVRLGVAGGEGGAEGGAAPSAVKAAGPAVTVAMGFEIIENMARFQRPNYFLDDHYGIWPGMELKERGTSFDLSLLGRLEKGKLVAHRTGSAEIGLDADGDGTGEIELPLRGSHSPVVAPYTAEDVERKIGFVTIVGQQQDIYQGIEVNLEPQDNLAILYVAPAGSVVGEVGGVPVRIIDEDMNGVYGNAPLSYGHIGLTKDRFQPEIDSLVVGDSKRAIPWSEFVQVGDAWYRFEPEKAGTEIRATPVEVATGTLVLAAKGIKPDYFIVQGQGEYENSYFDLAGSGKAEVPAGIYKFSFGLVSKGAKRQRIKALVLPGDAMGTFTVTAGSKVEIPMGAPFGFTAQFDASGEKLTVFGSSVAVTGVGGERYERMYGCVPRPEVSYREAGAKRGSKPERMDGILSQDELYKEGGYRQAWFPKDVVLEKRAEEDKVEIQLVEKKNKLFGKIESAWF